MVLGTVRTVGLVGRLANTGNQAVRRRVRLGASPVPWSDMPPGPGAVSPDVFTGEFRGPPRHFHKAFFLVGHLWPLPLAFAPSPKKRR